MVPYKLGEGKLGMPGYLFSLDEHEVPPARVVEGREYGMNSGSSLYHKPVNKKFLEHGWQAKTSQLLEKIQKRYDNSDSKDSLDSLNELIVTAGIRQMKAVVIPLYYENNNTVAGYHKVAQLYGALQGLSHLQLGIDVPMVHYHVNGPQKGRVTYLAQGRKELLTKALEVVEEMGNDPDLVRYIIKADMCAQVHRLMKTELGLDVTKPLRDQQHIVAKLRQEAHADKNSELSR